ncbi:5-hydroxytryptamine receptor 3A-like isoform X2 [Siphateles boraxobius]
MHLHWLIFVLFSLAFFNSECTGWKPKDCSVTEYAEAKKALFVRLGLDKNDAQFTKMWPLIFNDFLADASEVIPATIFVDMYVTSITVNEKAQSISTLVKLETLWPNSNMTWDTHGFCGIDSFIAPKNMFWTPDISIKESIKTEFGTKDSPNVLLFSDGYTLSTDFLSLTTACKMDLYKFPFDHQICNVTFQSTAYSVKEIQIDVISNPRFITQESKETFQAEGEWDLQSVHNISDTILIWNEMDLLIYQISIKRRPLLYVINIIVPVFFFLMLDLASFFIVGEEKLSFKVTLLLSISVMLLILSNTLPSMSQKMPLIGIFCLAIFCLIGISIMETIFVNYLKAKGAEKKSVETTSTDSGSDGGVRNQQNSPASVRDQNEKQSYTLDSLKQILTECWAATQRKQRQKTCLSWTGVARIIDVTFLVLYIITVIVLLSVLGKLSIT